jgi:zinc protease
VAAAAVGLVAGCGGAGLTPARPSVRVRPLEVERAVESFRLDSGLRVVLVPDRRTNLVSVDVRYETGALDDPAGRSGLAHLAEHLSFGIAGEDGATVAERLDRAALVYSAYTSWDETHFASLALAGRLADVLAVEASRMGARCERIAPALFERERDVVENEARERDPRGPWAPVAARLFPADHPYARPVGGAELGALRREDACAFLAGHYAPGRAILVVGGAIDGEAARGLVAAAFGAIRRAAAPARRLPQPAAGGESVLRGPIARPTAVLAFPAAARGEPGQAARDLALDLWVRRIADLGQRAGVRDAERGYLGGGRGGVELVAIAARDAAALPQAVEAAFAARGRLLDGDSSIARRDARALRINQELAALDRFEGLGARVADAVQHAGQAVALLEPLRELEGLWPDGLVHDVQVLGAVSIERYVDRAAESEALARAIDALPDRRGVHVAYLLPEAAAARSAPPGGTRRLEVAEWQAPVDLAEADRSLPVPAVRAAPALREEILPSGLRVVLAPVPGSAVVEARLVFPAGLIDEPAPGVAVLASQLLQHDMARDYTPRDLEATTWVLGLGARLTFEVGAASTVFRLAGAARHADWHVWRLFWLVEQGVYRDDALARARDEESLAAADDREHRLRRALAGALLGGVAVRERDAAAIRRIRRDQVESFRRAAFVPDRATLIVAGGFDPDLLIAEIRAAAAPWRGRRGPARPRAAPPGPPAQRTLALVDGESPQVSIALAFPASGFHSAARLVAAEMVDAQARAIRRRIGATYGLHAGYTILASAAPALLAGGDADPARAGDVLVALLASLDELRARGDAFRRAFVVARRRVLGRVLAQATDTAALAAELETLARVGWDSRRRQDLVAAVASLTPAAAAAALTQDLDRDHMVIAVAGPHRAIQSALRAARQSETTSPSSR